MNSIILLISLFLLLSSVSAWDNNSWDYYLLVVRYAGGQSTHLPADVKSWNLHGLWPNRDDNSYPSYCNNNYPFNYYEIKSIFSELNLYWTDFKGGFSNGSKFWTHEWDKHGTCAMSNTPTSDELKFFTAALTLLKKINFDNALFTANIFPSTSAKYSGSNIEHAIGKATGTNVVGSCTNLDDKTVLETVTVCVDKSLNFMNCPSSFVKKDENCDRDDVYLLPVPRQF